MQRTCYVHNVMWCMKKAEDNMHNELVKENKVDRQREVVTVYEKVKAQQGGNFSGFSFIAKNLGMAFVLSLLVTFAYAIPIASVSPSEFADVPGDCSVPSSCHSAEEL